MLNIYPNLQGGVLMERLLDMAKKLDEMETNISKLTWVQYTAGYDFGIEEAYKKMNEFWKIRKTMNWFLSTREKI